MAGCSSILLQILQLFGACHTTIWKWKMSLLKFSSQPPRLVEKYFSFALADIEVLLPQKQFVLLVGSQCKIYETW